MELRAWVQGAQANSAAEAANLSAALSELSACDAQAAALHQNVAASQLALEQTIRSHVAASRVAAKEAEAALERAHRRADASERAAISRLITSCRLAAERAALLSALRDADIQLYDTMKEHANLMHEFARAEDTIVQQQELRRRERRARALAAVSRAVNMSASETRLLLLLRSQRERLAAQSAELADVRMAAAAAHGRPELEGSWRAPSPSQEPGASGDKSEESDEGKRHGLQFDEAAIKRELLRRCRNDWLGAVAMTL